MSENLEKFLNRIADAAEQSTLVKMTLSKPAQKHDELRNIYVKPVLIKEKRLFAFTYHYERRDEVKNYDATQMLDMLNAPQLFPERCAVYRRRGYYFVGFFQRKGDPSNQEGAGMPRTKPGTR